MTANNATIGRVQPHSDEAEEAVLACCMLDGPEVIPRCQEAKLRPESMYDLKRGMVLSILYDLHAAGKPTDINVVAEEMKERRQLDQVGGYPFLTQISKLIPTIAEASYFIEKVREQALLREIIRTATGAVEDCYGYSGGIDEFVDGIEKKLFAVTQNRVADRTRQAGQIVPKAMSVIDMMFTRKGEMTGIRSGYADLDALTWGFQKQDMIVLAARPSMGKTALALNMADAMVLPARGAPTPVLVFSLEMSAAQLMQRMICARARINLKMLRNGMLSKNGEEMTRMTEAADQLARAPLYIDDSSAIPISHIRARARRIHAKEPLGAIIVDYLQLMGVTNKEVPREQQVSESSRGLKALAKELDVPVIVLSQLNRASEKDKRPPRLSDLRESGSIEQDADVVLLLARPGDADERYQVASDTVDLIVAKQRNGPVADVKLTFLRDITRFENHR